MGFLDSALAKALFRAIEPDQLKFQHEYMVPILKVDQQYRGG